MQPTDDSLLLRQYAENHSDEAFAVLVTRHINLVYSVALRCVGDPHQAEEIAQAVFILLAKKAAQLRHGKALSSWLFQTTRLTASNFIRGETRRHRREQEAHMQSVLNEPGSDVWPRIAPLLDDAVAGLNEKDRDAVVLRFYEGRSLREVGAALGASEDAAEKRVSRAVERLREFFAKRGVTVGTSELVVVISANAVQAAPVGLAVTISTAAALGGTIVSTTTATAAKVITMTTLQKTLVGVILVAAVGTGIYEAHKASTFRNRVSALEQQHIALTEQLVRERDDALGKLVALQREDQETRRTVLEVPRLRGEVARLRSELENPAQANAVSVGQRPAPVWQPLDLSQFPDSQTLVKYSSATNSGTGTPAALLQTWLCALRTGDAEMLKKVWDFPPDAPAGEMEREIEKEQRALLLRQERLQAGLKPNSEPYEDHRLIELLPLGQNKYLALVEIRLPATRTYVMKKVFRQVGPEWKLYCGKPAYSPSGE